jgi:hypothetical protein
MTSCKKELTMEEKLVGDWHCSSTVIDAEIYVTFTAAKTFILYQQIGEGAFRIYNGIYEFTVPADGSAQAVLTGEYNDGTPWGTGYHVSGFDGNVMTLTGAGVAETYSKINGGIPEDVLRSAVTVVKSEGFVPMRFL